MVDLTGVKLVTVKADAQKELNFLLSYGLGRAYVKVISRIPMCVPGKLNRLAASSRSMVYYR